MQVLLLQEDLSKVVSAVSRYVSSRPQLPILSHLLLKTYEGRLLVAGTDLVTTVGVLVGGQVQEDGMITVPARDFAAIVSGLSVGRVELIAKDGTLKIIAGKTKASLVGSAGADFPEVIPERGEGLTFSTAPFLALLGCVLFSVSQDEGRPILTGVKFESTGEKQSSLSLVSTDGYRLSLVTLPGAKGSFKDSFVIPGKTLDAVSRLATGKQLHVDQSSDGGVVFSWGDGWVSGRLLVGEFPAVQKIFPENCDVRVTLDPKELLQAVRVAAIFARESANIIKWVIGGGELKISANSPQIGEDETIVEALGEGAGEIAFNGKYLVDFLGTVDSAKRIVFEMAGPLKPGVFRVEGDNAYTHLIMPVRVQK